ncbi:MAG: chorismate-binding protein [Cyclobacteriaceae bacterium]|jgi:isochorismate synthase|nr:chorismate-binding protein [Cyclobacteriaceae bacterium]
MEQIRPGTGKLETASPLSLVIGKALNKQLALALWRLPGRATSTLIVSASASKLSREDAIEDLPAGFIFAPYRDDRPALFIEGSIRYTVQGNTVTGALDELDELSPKENGASHPAEVNAVGDAVAATPDDEKAHYVELVRKSIEAIAAGKFEKVVPTRVKQTPLPPNFDMAATYQRLCGDHPEALVSLVHIPGSGTWMGASPELLVSVEQSRIFRTVALAGTQPYREGTPLKQVAWTQKEIEEQALVERYIISCFKKIRLREYLEQGPKTVIAGNLIHLRSDFTVDLRETNFPQLGSVMLRLLHPTSAVCGMELGPAREFLRQNEGYDRAFYTGYLGPVNVADNTDIYVNLRCMQLREGYALMYAGAGVTADSVPETEWEETEIKFNTLTTSLT